MPKKRKRKTSDLPAVVRHDGGLCVTFVNSASRWRKSIVTYADLVAWGLRLDVLTGADGERLERAAAQRPAEAEAVARRAADLRKLAESVLRALEARRTPAAGDIETLNGLLSAVMANRRMVPAASGYRWDFGDRGGDDLDRVLWFVLLSLSDLLTTKYHRKVGRCAGEDCDLMLVDRSPGSPRKWCSRCGKPARARKYYQTTIKPMRQAMRQEIRASRTRKAEENRRRLREKKAAEED